MSEKIKALYSPTTGMIGCVLIQAGTGGNTSVAHEFDTEDWLLSPDTSLRMMEATREQWKFIAKLSREERVARWSR